MVAAVALQSSVNCLHRQGRRGTRNAASWLYGTESVRIVDLWSVVVIYLIEFDILLNICLSEY